MASFSRLKAMDIALKDGETYGSAASPFPVTAPNARIRGCTRPLYRKYSTFTYEAQELHTEERLAAMN